MTQALIAAVAMLVQDAISTVLVMAEARNRGWLAGFLDAAAWIVGITTATIAISTLQGNDLADKAYVVVFVSVANVLGTKLGQVIGSRFVHDATTLAERVARLEDLSIHIHDHKE